MKRKLIIEVESQEALNELGKIKGIIISTPSSVPMNIQEIIDGIIEDFDFDRVHDVMEYMDWEWYEEGISSKKYVPSIEKLKERATELLERAYNGYFEQGNSEQYSIQTGGFEAYYVYVDNEDCFELKFVLESVNNYY